MSHRISALSRTAATLESRQCKQAVGIWKWSQISNWINDRLWFMAGNVPQIVLHTLNVTQGGEINTQWGRRAWIQRELSRNHARDSLQVKTAGSFMPIHSFLHERAAAVQRRAAAHLRWHLQQLGQRKGLPCPLGLQHTTSHQAAPEPSGRYCPNALVVI